MTTEPPAAPSATGAGLARSRAAVLGAAVLFSTGAAAIKASAMTGWQVAGLRSAVAALFLVLVIPAARRGYRLKLVPVGLAYAATMVLFVLGNKLTTAANTIFLQSTAPLYVLVLSPILLKEAVRGRDLLFMALVALGLALFFIDVEPPQRSAPDPRLGNIFATAAGVAWAFTLLGLRWLGRGEAGGREQAIRSVVVGNALAALIAAPFALPLAGYGPADWGAIAYLGTCQIGVAYLLLTAGFRHLPALEGTLLLLLEPTLTPLWTWWTQGERPSALALLGGALVLLAPIARSAWERAELSRRTG